jgi:putative sterol carrier protein
VLDGGDGSRPWFLRIEDGAARAHRGMAPAPALTLRMPAAVFVRIAAGELSSNRALVDGQLGIDGDFALAQRLPEMFGDVSPY